MERPRPSSVAWLALMGSVAAYDILCPKEETLSEGLDPLLERPVTRAFLYGAVGTTALHLVNLLPENIDPFGQTSKYLNRIKA